MTYPTALLSAATLAAFALVGFALRTQGLSPSVYVFTGIVLGWQLGIVFCVLSQRRVE